MRRKIWTYSSKAIGWLIPVAAIYLAMLWMFEPSFSYGFIPTSFNVAQVFSYDGENNLWMMTYQGRAWRETGGFAEVFNFAQVCGMPFPLFYGWGYYPFAGLLSILCGPLLAVRFIAVAAMAIQYANIIRLGRKVDLPWGFRHIIAIAVTWSIYPLTNLYFRSDMPEFVAMKLMVSSLCCFLAIVLRYPKDPCVYERWAWGCFYVIACVTHPIIGYFGGWAIFLSALPLLFLRPFPRRIITEGLLVVLTCMLILAPWILVILTFLSKTRIGTWDALSSDFGWTYMQDSWRQLVPLRFYLYAREHWNPPGKDMWKLDSQISDALLFAAIALAILYFASWRQRTAKTSPRAIYFACLGLLITVLTFVGSSVPEWRFYTVYLFAQAQCAYRLVNFVDLGLLMLVMALAAMCQPLGKTAVRWLRGAAVIVLVIASIGLITKLKDQWHDSTDESAIWSLAHPYEPGGEVKCFYGRGDYSVHEGLEVLKPEGRPVVNLNFHSDPKGHLDQIPAQKISLSQPTLVTTSIQAFPWNNLIVDGRKLAPPELGYNDDADRDNNPGYACVLPPGEHVLSYQFIPSPWLGPLRTISFTLGPIWVLAVIWFAIQEIPWIKRRERTSSENAL